jgi:hypothetical protein
VVTAPSVTTFKARLDLFWRTNNPGDIFLRGGLSCETSSQARLAAA